MRKAHTASSNEIESNNAAHARGGREVRRDARQNINYMLLIQTVLANLLLLTTIKFVMGALWLADIQQTSQNPSAERSMDNYISQG